MSIWWLTIRARPPPACGHQSFRPCSREVAGVWVKFRPGAFRPCRCFDPEGDRHVECVRPLTECQCRMSRSSWRTGLCARFWKARRCETWTSIEARRQRLFNDYMGASPKCVRYRFRLHETLKRARGATYEHVRADSRAGVLRSGAPDSGSQIAGGFDPGPVSRLVSQAACTIVVASASRTRAVTSCMEASPSMRW